MNRPEQALARSVAAYLTVALPETVYWSAINPVPGKSKAAAAISKAMGLKPGVPDYLIVHRGICHFVELKAAKGSLSANQRIAYDDIVKAGGHFAVAKSLDALRVTLDYWRIPTRDASVRRAA